MSKIAIELDVKVVQTAINAKVAPAVNKVLAKYDLQKLIEKELEKKTPSADYRYSFLYASLGGHETAQTTMERLVQQCIREEATAFIKKALKSQQKHITAAFEKMLSGSSDVMAKTLFASLSSALENEWSFTIDSTVTAKQAERTD